MSVEWFDLVDECGRVTGRAPRADCHGNPRLLHQAVHVFVVNRAGEVFLQKRSVNKDVQPGKWDTSVGGHVDAGEAPDTAAARELSEELGVVGPTPRFLYRYLWRSPVESELIRSYLVRAEGPFRLHPSEIETGKFWSAGDIETALGADVFTPNFVFEWPRFKKNLFHLPPCSDATSP